jgi:cobyrinic acid a,c-diamide synthase
MASLFISAAHKSSGKTTVSIGLNAILHRRGFCVQPFKKGPDYIDPIWLGMAAGRPCYNLDFYTAGKKETIKDFVRRSAHAEISIIEGNKGLYDGLDLDGSNSNAALASALQTPVILVVDARGTMRGIAPLLIGYQVFDAEVNIAGVIANMTGGARHESKLRAAVEHYTDIPFLGALANDSSISLAEKHIGLIPGYEDPEARDRISCIADAINDNVDVDKIIDIANTAPNAAAKPPAPTQIATHAGLRIGIAQDSAFGFYYPGDLEAIEATGAELVPVNTLHDRELPFIDGLFIGGGFPERHAALLEANTSLRQAIKTAIEAGLPVYAECGGLMYLSRQLSWQGKSFDMVGVIPAQTTMHDRPCGRGYVKLEESTRLSHWPQVSNNSATIYAHEFHYSSLDGLPENSQFAYQVMRGHGINQTHDGLLYKNLLASYAHLRNTPSTPWVERFLSFVGQHKATGKTLARAMAQNS